MDIELSRPIKYPVSKVSEPNHFTPESQARFDRYVGSILKELYRSHAGLAQEMNRHAQEVTQFDQKIKKATSRVESVGKLNDLTKDWIFGLVKHENNKKIDIKDYLSKIALHEKAISSVKVRQNDHLDMSSNFVTNNAALVVTLARKEMEADKSGD